MFESARCWVGSFAASDVIATIRPLPLRSRCGRQSRTSRIAGWSSSSNACSSAVGGDVGRLARRRPAGVPDEDVEPAERLDRLRDGALEVLRERHVAADGERAEPVGLAFEHVAAPREHRHVRAFLGERLRACERQPGGGAADERGAPFQPEIHGSPR